MLKLRSQSTIRSLVRARSMATVKKHVSLEAMAKKSPFLKLRGEPDGGKMTPESSKRPRQVPEGFWTRTWPTARTSYQFLSAAPNALTDLGLDVTEEPKSQYFRDTISGKIVDKEFPPYSMAYAGFQFGEFAGQLGDGRVINLFQLKDHWDLQLKGTGLTPFSRFADGKAVLRSSIREYVISEALHAIGIPSTRALGITALPQTLAQRQGAEMCAIVARMAPSWIRIGHFDLCRMRGDRNGVKELSDYVIEDVLHGQFSSELDRLIANQGELEGELTTYDKFYLDVIIRNAKTVAYWHAYGFLNGVLNTDNTSIIGLSMDFGPFAFMDHFDPNYTPNSEDHTLRYSFKNTPSAIWYNLVKLGESMGELLGAGPKYIDDPVFLQNGVKEEWIDEVTKRAMTIIDVGGQIYERVFIDYYLKLMCNRLGITPRESDNSEVLAVLFEVLQETKVDYNKFFVNLQNMKINSDDEFDYELSPLALVPDHLKSPERKSERDSILKEMRTFLATFKARVEEEQVSDETRLERASKYNPLFIPRNWVFNEVIDYTTQRVREIKERLQSGEEVSSEMELNASAYLNKLIKMSSNPYDKSKWGSELKELEEKWTKDVEQDSMMLTCSCSS